MVGPEYRERTAEICLPIANDSITTIYNTHFSSLHQELERYSSITYLTGAIIPIACIILKSGQQSPLRETAVDLFRKAMILCHDMAPGFALARATLKRLRRIVSAVEFNINGGDKDAAMNQTSETLPSFDMDADMGDCLESGQYSANLFDLLYDASLNAPFDDGAVLGLRTSEQAS